MSTWQWSQVIGFQVFWWLSVRGGNAYLGVLLALIVLHCVATPSRSSDLRVIPLMLLGIAVDVTLTFAGVFDFSQPPYWLALLWVAFVLTLGHSLAWLRRLPLVAQAALGAVGGCSSYLAGNAFTAVSLPYGIATTAAVLCFVWALLMPLLVYGDNQLRAE